MRPIVVVKVGGSLLDWPPLPDRLPPFLAALGEVRPLLIVGGGQMVDALRDLDRVHQIGQARSHALALRILDVTARLLVDLVAGTTFVTQLVDLDRTWDNGTIPVLAPRHCLNDDDRLDPADALPHSWAVTSDSIAARVATLVGAEELVLLKSANQAGDSVRLQGSSLVDPHFSIASRYLSRIRTIDFRRSQTHRIKL